MNKRIVKFGVLVFEARQEVLKRDGGDPPREWYWTVQDPKMGSCIDERVPGGYWKTLRAARSALSIFLGDQLDG